MAKHRRPLLDAATLAKLIDKRFHAFLWAAAAFIPIYSLREGTEGAVVSFFAFTLPILATSIVAFAISMPMIAGRRLALKNAIARLEAAGAGADELRALHDGMSRARVDAPAHCDARVYYLDERLERGELVPHAPLAIEGPQKEYPDLLTGGLREMRNR